MNYDGIFTKPADSPPDNGGGGLKRAPLDEVTATLDDSPPDNGGGGLKLNGLFKRLDGGGFPPRQRGGGLKQ